LLVFHHCDKMPSFKRVLAFGLLTFGASQVSAQNPGQCPGGDGKYRTTSSKYEPSKTRYLETNGV
jgi:hypothetical protein